MGLIEQHAAVSPRSLLVTPVTVLWRDYGINVCPYLRIPQHVDRIPRSTKDVLQTSLSHLSNCLLQQNTLTSATKLPSLCHFGPFDREDREELIYQRAK